MSTRPDEIRNYYDAHIIGKLDGFVEGNDRVEKAWATVQRFSPANPSHILEIGCGIGDVCWRMARRWPEANVVGIDISPASIEAANKLFATPRVRFQEGRVAPGTISGQFDLIVLMDVYEHIGRDDRPDLHQALRALLTDRGRIVLSVPTPRYLDWLKRHAPEEIQPVDEDITVQTLDALASATSTSILYYSEVDVWHEGDYAHAVLGRHIGWRPVEPVNNSLRSRLSRWRRGARERRAWGRGKRLEWVKARLAPSPYSVRDR